jgi:HEAT repeat protein
MRTLPVLALTVLAMTLPTSIRAQKADKGSTKTSQSRSPSSIAGKSLKEWIKDLKNPDPGVREAAVQTVALFGVDGQDAVPHIIDLLERDRDVSLRVNAAIALSQIAIRDADVHSAVRALAKQASSNLQAIVRLRATMALGRFEDEAKEAIPDLIRASRDLASWEIRKAAVTSLARIAPDKKNGPHVTATNAIIAASKDPSAWVRREAVMSLGLIGAPTNPAVKGIVISALRSRIAADRDKPVVIWAYVGLMSVDKVTDPCIKQLIKMLETGDVDTRMHALRALGMVGSEVKKQLPKKINDVVHAMISSLKDHETVVSGTACWALSHLGQNYDPGNEAMNALDELAKSKTVDSSVKQMALVALDSLKGKKEPKESIKP